MKLFVVLVAIAVALVVVGLVVHGLFYLFIVGIVIFLGDLILLGRLWAAPSIGRRRSER